MQDRPSIRPSLRPLASSAVRQTSDRRRSSSASAFGRRPPRPRLPRQPGTRGDFRARSNSTPPGERRSPCVKRDSSSCLSPPAAGKHESIARVAGSLPVHPYRPSNASPSRYAPRTAPLARRATRQPDDAANAAGGAPSSHDTTPSFRRRSADALGGLRSPKDLALLTTRSGRRTLPRDGR